MELKIDTYNHRFDKQDTENRQQFFCNWIFLFFLSPSPCKILKWEPFLKGRIFICGA